MYIGHINLDRSMNGNGEHFVKLVERLDRQGVKQHVLVANASLARRVAIYENVLVGPVVRQATAAWNQSARTGTRLPGESLRK